MKLFQLGLGRLRLPVLTLAVSSSHRQCIVSVLIIPELARVGVPGRAEISALAEFEPPTC